MSERGVDHVQIALLNPHGRLQKTIMISWETRQMLLEQMQRHDWMRDIVDAFEAVGTSRPVELNTKQKDELSRMILAWKGEVADGYAGPPEGIEEFFLDLNDCRRRTGSRAGLRM